MCACVRACVYACNLKTTFCFNHRSLGIRGEQNSNLIGQIKDTSHHNMIQKNQLFSLLKKYLPSLNETWPSHSDVMKAFRVFDTEGVGFIKVTMLKRFLVQSQLDVDETVCKFVCMHGDDNILDKEGGVLNVGVVLLKKLSQT